MIQDHHRQMTDKNKVEDKTFTLPNGQSVLIGKLSQKDYMEINSWVQQRYIENVTQMTRFMEPQEKQEFMLAALSHASKLAFHCGDGMEILFATPLGMAKLTYAMIRNPPMSFDEFNEMVFPGGWINAEGFTMIGDMTNAVYHNNELPRPDSSEDYPSILANALKAR